jgi:hypothetical protein
MTRSSENLITIYKTTDCVTTQKSHIAEIFFSQIFLPSIFPFFFASLFISHTLYVPLSFCLFITFSSRKTLRTHIDEANTGREMTVALYHCLPIYRVNTSHWQWDSYTWNSISSASIMTILYSGPLCHESTARMCRSSWKELCGFLQLYISLTTVSTTQHKI